MFILIVAIIQGIIFLLHYIVYGTFIYFVAPTFALDPSNLFWIRAFFLLMSVSFVGINIFNYRMYSKFGERIYQIAAVWFGTIYFLYLGSFVISIFKTSPTISSLIFMTACLVSIGCVINSFAIRIKEVEISLSYTPEIWKGKKAIVFSDSHLGNMRGKNFIQKIADLIISRHPDIVFMVGDLFDGSPVPYGEMISSLRSLSDKEKVPLGTFFVTGNHEEFDDPSPFLNAIKAVDIKILDNQTENVLGITIAGVDYKATEKKEEYEKILKAMLIGVDKQTPIILLKHVPSNLEVAEANSVDLCLHGHSHNGQMWPFNYIARRLFKGYEYGHKKYKDMDVITNSGVGTWGPPQRFFTQSQIVEIVFK